LNRTYTDLGIPEAREVYQDHLKVRVPFNYVKITDPQRRSLSFRFLATPRVRQGAGAKRADAQIASVMPGRYAVLGSAGTSYYSSELHVELDIAHEDHRDPAVEPRPRFMATVGRLFRSDRVIPQAVARTLPEQHLKSLQGARRIELGASLHPIAHQVL